MEHPDIIVRNADMHYKKMLQDAEEWRKATRLTVKTKNTSLFAWLWKRLAPVSGKNIEKPASSGA